MLEVMIGRHLLFGITKICVAYWMKSFICIGFKTIVIPKQVDGKVMNNIMSYQLKYIKVN